MALNEYGAKLDRNGYAPSLMVFHEGECFQCGKRIPTERHEVFGGALRDKSKAYGLWANLCPECHRTGKNAVHQSALHANLMKIFAQTVAMTYYGWTKEEWMQRFYKNYIREEEENV